MKSLMIITLIVVAAFFISSSAVGGKLYEWTDENGVTHISSQPPQDDVNFKQSNYIKNPGNASNKVYKPKQNTLPVNPKNPDFERERNLQRIKSDNEAEKQKQIRERERQQAEFDKAKSDYEYFQSRKEIYKENYHKASSKGYRDYWYKKMQEADEAETEYFRIKSKYKF